MRTPPPQLPEPSPEPPAQSLLPAFPALPAPALPVPALPAPALPVPAQPVPAAPPPQRPLPDPVALPSRIPVPAAGPPFDDEAGLDLPSPRTALAAAEPDRESDQPGRAEPRQADGPSGPPPETAGVPPSDGPVTGAWASLFAQALAEALAGSRPSRQIAPWTTEQARRRIRQLGPMLQDGPRPVVRRVLTSMPRRDVVEMTVIIGVGPRTRAIAVRLERARPSSARPDRGRPWICTVIEAA
jgi:Family of unknown function (DUF6459)